VAKNSGGSAYEGAFEAVGAILIATLLGYWFDEYYETTPTGVLVGAAIGFGAFVLRLFRMGRQLHPEPGADEAASKRADRTTDSDDPARTASDEGQQEQEEVDQVGSGIGLGLSDVLRSDSERKDEDR
jgi:hypothetical protein